MKTCTNCLLDKPLSEFCFDKKYKRYHGQCRKCTKVARKRREAEKKVESEVRPVKIFKEKKLSKDKVKSSDLPEIARIIDRFANAEGITEIDNPYILALICEASDFIEAVNKRLHVFASAAFDPDFSVKVKTCRRCGKVKELKQFNKSYLRRNGTWSYHNICRMCRNEQTYKRTRNNPDFKKYQREYYQKNRESMLKKRAVYRKKKREQKNRLKLLTAKANSNSIFIND